MTWQDHIARIAAFDGLDFDAGLLADMARAFAPHPLAGAAPSFLSYDSDEFPGCGRAAFPTFSITGPACALNCGHCRAEVLRPMIPATSPAVLEREVRRIAETRHLRGFLLSGGSNRRNEIPYARYWPTIARLKRDLPGIEVAVHTGLIDAPRARAMAGAGVDLAMIDIIGAQDTVREVYHLDRPVADFQASLAALCEAGLRVAPHIVIGLHFGEIRGERRALEICLRHPISALVLVVVMPQPGQDRRFVPPDTDAVGRFLLDARHAAPGLPVTLGCARPHGTARRKLDAYAVMAGLDAIAFPADGAIPLARALGRPITADPTCCALGALRARAA
ncbi:MAG: radical SAM protein [Roseovarius sp.]|nr:radical SAM protein [Roseovarius sp.]